MTGREVAKEVLRAVRVSHIPFMWVKNVQDGRATLKVSWRRRYKKDEDGVRVEVTGMSRDNGLDMQVVLSGKPPVRVSRWVPHGWIEEELVARVAALWAEALKVQRNMRRSQRRKG